MTIDTSFTPVANLEVQLLGLWNKFLNRSDLTIDDDFFESGGDFLLATELLFKSNALCRKPFRHRFCLKRVPFAIWQEDWREHLRRN